VKLPALSAPRWVPRVRPFLVAAAGGFATVAALIFVQGAGAPVWAVNVAMLLPAAVTFTVVPSSRRRWYRWLVILALAQVVYPWVTAPLLLVGTAWALWRSWFVERTASPVAAPKLAGVRKDGRAAHPRGRTPSAKTATTGPR